MAKSKRRKQQQLKQQICFHIFFSTVGSIESIGKVVLECNCCWLIRIASTRWHKYVSNMPMWLDHAMFRVKWQHTDIKTLFPVYRTKAPPIWTTALSHAPASASHRCTACDRTPKQRVFVSKKSHLMRQTTKFNLNFCSCHASYTTKCHQIEKNRLVFLSVAVARKFNFNSVSVSNQCFWRCATLYAHEKLDNMTDEMNIHYPLYHTRTAGTIINLFHRYTVSTDWLIFRNVLWSELLTENLYEPHVYLCHWYICGLLSRTSHPTLLNFQMVHTQIAHKHARTNWHIYNAGAMGEKKIRQLNGTSVKRW